MGCCRGFTAPRLRPRAHRRAVKRLDRNGNGLIFCAFALSSVRWRHQPVCLLTHRDRCQRSMFVARDDHDEAEIIACPLPDCDNIWCKQCQQTVDIGGPRHSCDGTLELDHLMKQQGWKYCPCMSVLTCYRKSPTLFFLACRTPIQKVSGCNHMSVSSIVIWRLSADQLITLPQCMTPACNT